MPDVRTKATENVSIWDEINGIEKGVDTNPLIVSSSRFLERFRAPHGDRAIFGAQVIGFEADDISIDFSVASAGNLVDQTVSGGGTVTSSNARINLASSTGATGAAAIQTRDSVDYRPGHETQALFTGVWSTPAANSTALIGLFDANNGFAVGYNGTSFSVLVRNAGADTFTAQTSWNGDKCDGGATSNFTRGGVVEALDPTKENVFRIRFGWLGAAVILFEVMSPDGDWLVMHVVRQPNLSANPSIADPTLPLRAAVAKTSGATNITLGTSSWRASAIGALRPAKISNENSTTALLGAGATFTGAFVDALNYVSLTVVINASVDSAVDGIVIDYSSDGVTLDRPFRFTYFAAAGGQHFSVPVIARYVRVSYTNTSTGAQTGTFHLQTQFDGSRLQPVAVPLNQRVPRNTFSGEVTRTDILPLTQFATNQQAVGTSSVQVSRSLAQAKTITLKANPDNGNNVVIYIGTSASVTTTTGFPLSVGDSVDIELSDQNDSGGTVDIWAISNSGSSSRLSVMEVA